MSSNENKFILLAVETSSIQDYIFGSNRLKENIGASYLVKQATEDWAFEAIRSTTTKSNVKEVRVREYEIDPDRQITEADVYVEVIYAGGGNFIAIFKDKTDADKFTTILSTKVLKKAPGLTLNVHQEGFKWNKEETGLGAKVSELLKNMKSARGTKKVSAPVLGLGVTVMCQSTAMPAVELDPDDSTRYVSAEVYAKVDAANKEANNWLDGKLTPGDGYIYPRDFDDMGRSRSDTSYLAIVHADGNGMGAIISDLGSETNNRQYITNMRKFSEQIKEISTKAMTVVLDQLRSCIVPDEKNPKIKIIKSSAKSVEDIVLVGNNLPIRPIVFGGDDTTFVCDGRLGLELATIYLQAFQDAAKAEGLTLSACAGISMVKTHYPFARAYKLAEKLCESAKTFRKDYKFEGGALDWYFTAGGLYSDLENMRQREYFVKGVGELTLRPVSLDEKKDGVICWDDIKRVTRVFQGNKNEEKVTQDSDTGWGDKRNKVKALRDALRNGPDEVTKFITIYGGELPEFEPFTSDGWSPEEKKDEKAQKDGKIVRRCGYFDALELLDIYLPLDKGATK